MKRSRAASKNPVYNNFYNFEEDQDHEVENETEQDQEYSEEDINKRNSKKYTNRATNLKRSKSTRSTRLRQPPKYTGYFDKLNKVLDAKEKDEELEQNPESFDSEEQEQLLELKPNSKSQEDELTSMPSPTSEKSSSYLRKGFKTNKLSKDPKKLHKVWRDLFIEKTGFDNSLKVERQNGVDSQTSLLKNSANNALIEKYDSNDFKISFKKKQSTEINKEALPEPSFSAFNIYDQLGFMDPTLHKHFIKYLFIRPNNRYIRATDNMENINSVIEYDLDLEDKSWLENLQNQPFNKNEKNLELFFEKAMDLLEKRWFKHTRQLDPHHALHISEPNPDAPCEICQETECENSNAIVFCDGCDLAVHQDCYGVPYIPEGQWLCRKCMLSPSNPVSCVLCPNEGGAFKQTTFNTWAHVTCALWIPEISFGNLVYVEPIEGIDKIPKSRWKLLCYLCKQRKGACIQCCIRSCSAAFHVTCAFIANFSMKYKLNTDAVNMKAYCHKHTLKDNDKVAPIQKIQKEFELRFKKRQSQQDSESVDESSPPQSSIKPVSVGTKAARAHQQSFSSKQMIIPDYIFHEVLFQLYKEKVRGKHQLLVAICKYWTLKKEDCRGAIFIKRLHLEPWTASTPLQSEEEKAANYESMKHLRSNLNKARIILQLIRQRDSVKLHLNQIRYNYWERYFFPQVRLFRSIIDSLKNYDRYGFFSKPVTVEEAPDYFEHISEPMDFGTLSHLINIREICTFETFQEKLLLIYTNCMAYNDPTTEYHKVAKRGYTRALELIKEAKQEFELCGANPKTGFLDMKFCDKLLTLNWRDSKDKNEVKKKRRADKGEVEQVIEVCGEDSNSGNSSELSKLSDDFHGDSVNCKEKIEPTKLLDSLPKSQTSNLLSNMDLTSIKSIKHLTIEKLNEVENKNKNNRINLKEKNPANKTILSVANISIVNDSKHQLKETNLNSDKLSKEKQNNKQNINELLEKTIDSEEELNNQTNKHHKNTKQDKKAIAKYNNQRTEDNPKSNGKIKEQNQAVHQWSQLLKLSAPKVDALLKGQPTDQPIVVIPKRKEKGKQFNELEHENKFQLNNDVKEIKQLKSGASNNKVNKLKSKKK